jgi:hypothetical protein
MRELSLEDIQKVDGGIWGYVARAAIAVYANWDRIAAASAMVNPGGGDDLRP